MVRIVNKGNSSILLGLVSRTGNDSYRKEIMNTLTQYITLEGVEGSEYLVETSSFTKGNDVNNGVLNSSMNYNWNLTQCAGLRELNVGSDSDQDIRRLKMDGFETLESIRIGQRRLSHTPGTVDIRNCAKLVRVVIGDGSCVQWDSFVIMNCNALREVSIGDGCFLRCKSVVLESKSYQTK